MRPIIDEIEFTYCPRCGGVLTPQVPTHLQCATCSLTYYVNPRPCNAIIVRDDMSRILMIKRKYDPHKGTWDLPGGFVDLGETLEESVTREAREELGVTVRDMRFLFTTVDRYEYSGLRYHLVGAFFEVTISPTDVARPQDDAEAVHYFPIREIPWDDIGFTSIRSGLTRYVGL